MVFDAGQVVLGQSNRALGDSWGTTLCFFLAFWCVMVPVALLLAFHAGLAEAGLFIGTAAGCVTAVALLGLRFRRLLGADLSDGPPAADPVLDFLAFLPQGALLGARPRAALARPARASARRRSAPPWRWSPTSAAASTATCG